MILKTITGFFLIMSLFLLSACSKEASHQIDVSYGLQTLDVDFRSEGETPAPYVKWNGDAGVFSLKNEVEGIAIDANSGIISWNNALAVGATPIVVVVENGNDRVEISLTVESTLSESYWLFGRNNDKEGDAHQLIVISRQLKLNSDGTLQVKIINEEGSLGVGVWSLNGNLFEMHVCFSCEVADSLEVPTYDEHSFYSGTLVNYGSDGASIQGQWYIIRFDPDSSTLWGQFGGRISNANYD
ncbi:hypothetical protein [Zobellia galactanivorans]|nr:hypothetical protein [Zobellia galactanivorans]